MENEDGTVACWLESQDDAWDRLAMGSEPFRGLTATRENVQKVVKLFHTLVTELDAAALKLEPTDGD